MTGQRHPDWCARGHRCGLGEHRSDPIGVQIPGSGHARLTRVQGADGREHAEIRMQVALPASEPHARYRLAALLTHLETLIGPTPTIHRSHRRAA
jgi:hypothetical protein